MACKRLAAGLDTCKRNAVLRELCAGCDWVVGTRTDKVLEQLSSRIGIDIATELTSVSISRRVKLASLIQSQLSAAAVAALNCSCSEGAIFRHQCFDADS